MSLHTTATPPRDWNEKKKVFYDASRIDDTHTITFTGKVPSDHVKITLIPGETPELRLIVFAPGGERIVDEPSQWNMDELATAFGTHRKIDATNQAFAESHGAKLGLPGKYVRTGDYLILLGPEHLDDKGNISVLLRDQDEERYTIRRRAGLFFEHSIPRLPQVLTPDT